MNKQKKEKEVRIDSPALIEGVWKGRCQHCNIRTINYKRDGVFYCHRCNRTYDAKTGLLVDSFFYTKDGKRKHQ